MGENCVIKDVSCSSWCKTNFTLTMESQWDFDCDVSTAILHGTILRDSLHQAMRSIVYMLLFVARWFTAIGTYVQN